jgi:iron-sulfur cluster assembly protein
MFRFFGQPLFRAAGRGYAKAVLTLTPEATKAIERILSAPGVEAGAGMRLIAADPGDGQISSELHVELAEGPAEGDEVIEEARARVFVEDSLCGYLADKVLDAETVEDRVRFSLAGQPA